MSAPIPRRSSGDERRRRELKFIAIKPGRTEPLSKGWQRRGATYLEGSYRLNYTAFDGKPVTFRGSDYELVLEIVDDKHRVRKITVNGGAKGARRNIGRDKLGRLLEHIFDLKRWGEEKVPCWLVVLKNNSFVSRSKPVMLKTPVKPWIGIMDPELFVDDNTIKYCGDRKAKEYGDSEAKKRYYGRTLIEIGGRRYFTFKNVLETDKNLRGFACIGLAGTLYKIVPQPKEENPYSNGWRMAATLNGKSFDWPDKPAKGKFQKEDIDEKGDLFDRENALVKMGRGMFLKFIASETGGKKGTYLVWKRGHSGIIQNGILYECKPPGAGFTKKSFDPATEGAVLKFTTEELQTQLKKETKEFFLSELGSIPRGGI